MSLLNKRRMTEKSLAAHRRNAKLSGGPATPEGRERARDAHVRHGFYSKSEEVALRALGKDPDEFRKLREALRGKGTSADTLEEQIADRLARSFSLLNRADRMQEGRALRKAREEDCQREGRLHVEMMRLKMTARNWHFLAVSVARECYVTLPYDLDVMKQLHRDGLARDMSEVALGLFYQLREPGTPGPGDPGFESDESLAQQRMVLFRIKQIFGLEDRREPDEETRFGRRVPAASAAPAAGGTAASAGPAGGATPPAAETPSPQAPATRDDNPASGGANSEPGVSKSVFRDAYPGITEEQWEEREPVRQLLENLLTRQVEIFEAQHHELMRQCLKGPSPHERAAEFADTYADAQFMQRMGDSNFRQIVRLSSLLLRMKREERLGRARQNPRQSGKVKQNKGN